MSDAGLWRRAEDLFHRALEQPVTNRHEFVREHCGGDATLLERVSDMLLETTAASAFDDEPPTPAEPAVRARFGRYDIVKEIGRGGMGVVYEARQQRLNRSVALKVLRSERDVLRAGGTRDRYVQMAARFVEEAEVLGLLDHPGIVPVLELDHEPDGVTWFTMRLVQGEDLRPVLDRARDARDGWTLHRALGVLRRVCDTMSFAHHRGVLHRDLKPSNIMVGAFGEVYIIDWGLARIDGRAEEKDVRLREAGFEATSSGEEEPLCTVDGDVVGTPAYMSPEQAQGRLDRMGAHSDVYSVGAILYQLLTSRPPHTPVGERDAYAVLSRVLDAPPAPVLTLAPGTPPELAAICERAMARDVARRYPTMEALAAELDAYLSNRAVQAYRTGPATELRLWYVRNRILAHTVMAFLAALLIALVLLIFSNLDLSRRNDDVFRLSVAQDVGDCVAEVDSLWPADEARAPALRDWIRRVEALLAARSSHEDLLQLLRERALPWSDEDRRLDRATHPEAVTLADVRRDRERFRAQLIGLQSDPGFHAHVPAAQQRLDDAEAEVTRLEQVVGARRTWRFESREDSWWHDQLGALVDELSRLEDPDKGLLDGISGEHGWGVRRRHEHARSIRERTVSSEAARVAWTEAVRSIADPADCPAYDGLRVVPQVGLLPLRRNPATALWEFWHVATGDAPTWDDAIEEWSLSPRSGLIFVLLPGGEALVGAEADPASPHPDPEAGQDEGPVHAVELAPFFMSKHEMTQGQWLRFTGENPSIFKAPFEDGGRAVSLLHPVDTVEFDAAAEQLRRLGLAIPTEAEWEYADRAGSPHPWWPGDRWTELAAYGNLADRAFGASQTSSSSPFQPTLEDGWGVTAPVGRYRPNAFGLHDTIGNVPEWCRGPYGVLGYTRESEATTVPTHVARGGGFNSLPADARSANRLPQLEEQGNFCTGVRPCRPLLDHALDRTEDER